jgi:hypothetical protein
MIDWDKVYHQVVNDNWTVLAAYAWKHYLEKGRGAVLVQVDDLVEAAPALKGGSEMEVQVSYLPNHDLARLTADTAAFVEQYDPTTEVVILFTGLDQGGNLAYRCKTGDGPVPPDAYRLFGHEVERVAWRLH